MERTSRFPTYDKARAYEKAAELLASGHSHAQIAKRLSRERITPRLLSASGVKMVVLRGLKKDEIIRSYNAQKDQTTTIAVIPAVGMETAPITTKTVTATDAVTTKVSLALEGLVNELVNELSSTVVIRVREEAMRKLGL